MVSVASALPSVGMMNLFFAVLVAFVSRECLENTYIHFSNTTFLIGTVFINLGNCIWGI